MTVHTGEVSDCTHGRGLCICTHGRDALLFIHEFKDIKARISKEQN